MSGQTTGWVLREGPRPTDIDREGRQYGERARGYRAVLLTIADAANRDGEHAHPGIQAMVDGSLYTRSHVLRVVAELVAEGWVTVEAEGGGRGKATTYRVETRRERVSPGDRSAGGKGLMAGPKRSHGEPERVTSGRETVSCQAADLGERAPYGLDNQLPTETRDGERAPDPLVLVSPSTEGDPFHTFWRTYPRRVGKPEAERAYRAVVKLAAPDVILAGLARWVTYWTARGEPEFTPHPSTWLRRHGWEDEPPPVKGASGQPGGPMGVVDEDRDGPSGRIFL